MPVISAEINQSQVLILQTLAKRAEGMSRAQLEEKCRGAVTSGNLGVVGSEAHPSSLYQLSMITITEHDVEGRMTLIYKITGKGRRAAETMKVKAARQVKIDPKKLDAVVVAFRPTRTYGIDAYNDDDIKEIKAKLNGGAEGVTIDDLRQQIANRRKQGAYADPTDKVKRQAKATLAAFGDSGWIHQGLLSRKAIAILTEMAKTGQVVLDDGSLDDSDDE